MAAADLSGVAARARAWRDSAHARICDGVEPWEHGTVRRAARYPGYYEFNAVRVDGDPQMSVEQLIGVADGALAGLEHRRIDVDELAVAERYRPGFEALGWRAMRLATDLWIVADDDDRPKALYARLGFRPAWTTMEFLRLPVRQATEGAPSGS